MKLNPAGFFLSSFIVIIVYNILLYAAGTADFITDLLAGLLGIIATVTAVVIISSVNLLGSGLNPSSIRILFGIGVLISLFFKIEVGPLRVGMGLGERMLGHALSMPAPLNFFAFAVAFILVAGAIVSALIIIVGRGD